MKISNGFKSTTFAAAALCFVVAAGTASARPQETDNRDFSPRRESVKDDNRIKKVGKVVGLDLDVNTNAVSATVAVGTLNKPDFPKKGEKADGEPNVAKTAENKNIEPKKKGEKRPDFITVGDERVQIDLNNTKVLGIRPPAPEKLRGRENARNGHDCCGNNGEKKQPAREKMDKAKVERNDFRQKKAPMPAFGGGQLKIGEVVQLIYSEDGSTVEAIVPLPPPPMARR